MKTKTIKFTLLTLVFTIAIMLSGCSKSTNSSPNPSNNNPQANVQSSNSDASQSTNPTIISDTNTNNGSDNSQAVSTPSSPDTSSSDVASYASSEPTLDMATVANHNTKGDCRTVVNDKIYDITKFIALGIHKPVIVQACGIDSTAMFEGQRKHTEVNAQDTLDKYLLGSLIK